MELKWTKSSSSLIKDILCDQSINAIQWSYLNLLQIMFSLMWRNLLIKELLLVFLTMVIFVLGGGFQSLQAWSFLEYWIPSTGFLPCFGFLFRWVLNLIIWIRLLEFRWIEQLFHFCCFVFFLDKLFVALCFFFVPY